MHIGIIGAGKVGFSLGKYFSEHEITITGYYSQNPESAKEASRFTNSKFYHNLNCLVHDSNIIFITVPDSKIMQIYHQIKHMQIANKQICHCSGAMTVAEAFPDIIKYHAYGYAIHPLFPISSKYHSYLELKNAFFCIEGDKTYLDKWECFFKNLGNPVRIISAETKTEYHTACTIASNFVCGLLAESIALLKKCGFTQEEALVALKPLAMNNINRIFEVNPVNALTGAIERCDGFTIRKHLACLDSELDLKIYQSMSLKLIELAQEKHPDINYESMKQIIKDICFIV